jgi:hypothetical protein
MRPDCLRRGRGDDAQVSSAAGAGTTARGELIGKLRALFDDVKYYMSHRGDYDRAQTRTLSAPFADLEALIPVVEGRMPLIIDADSMAESTRRWRSLAITN